MADRDVNVKVHLNADGNLESNVNRLKEQLASMQSGLSNGTLATQLREQAHLQAELAQTRMRALQEAGLAPSHDGNGHMGHALGRIARPILRHAAHVVPGLAGLMGPLVTLGPIAGAAAAAVTLVTSAIGGYEEALKRQMVTVQEASQRIAAMRQAAEGIGGSTQRVTRGELESVMNTSAGLRLLNRLEAANPQERQRIIGDELARARREFSGIDTAALSQGRREAAARLQETNAEGFGWFGLRSLFTGSRSLENERRAILGSPADMFGHGGIWNAITGAREGLGGRIDQTRSIQLAETAQGFRRATELQGTIAVLEAAQRGGTGNLNALGSNQKISGLQAGTSGSIEDLHQAIQQASIQGEQRNWQNDMLDAARRTAAATETVVPASQRTQLWISQNT